MYLLKKDVSFLWDDAQQQSFDALTHAFTHVLIFAFPDYKQPFTISTDASALSISAVPMNTADGQRPHAIAYASHVLNAVESKYSVTHLDVLAVAWALKHFRDVFFSYPITVYTHQTEATQFFNAKNLTGRLARL